jgi:hypothetical protein
MINNNTNIINNKKIINIIKTKTMIEKLFFFILVIIILGPNFYVFSYYNNKKKIYDLIFLYLIINIVILILIIVNYFQKKNFLVIDIKDGDNYKLQFIFGIFCVLNIILSSLLIHNLKDNFDDENNEINDENKYMYIGLIISNILLFSLYLYIEYKQ